MDSSEFDPSGFTPVEGEQTGTGYDQTQSLGMQRRMVALCLLDHNAYSELGPAVFNDRLVSHPPLKIIAKELFQACADNNGIPPSTDLFEELVKERKNTLKPTISVAVQNEFDLVATTNLQDASLLKSKAVEWARDEALALAVIKGSAMLERGTKGNGTGTTLLRMVQDALAIGEQSSPAISMVHDLDQIEESLSKKIFRIPTGLPTIDKSMRGGAELGLNLIAGEPKLGKTSFLTQLSIGGCRRGFTVWQVSGEVSRDSMMSRFTRGMTGRTGLEVWRDRATAMKILRAYQQTGGDILLDYQPGFTVEWMYSRMRTFERMGKRIDLVIADYIDIMGAAKAYGEKRHELETICNGLHKFSTDTGAHVWSAKAVNRKAVAKPIVTKADLAECFAVGYIATNMLALCSTEEERRNTTIVNDKIIKAPIIRVFYAAGRDLPDEYVIAAYERDNERQRWRELPDYVEKQADTPADYRDPEEDA